MTVLDDLEAYFLFMQRLGFSGLALEHNPFHRAPAPAKPIQPKTTVAEKPAKSGPEIPNLISIMEMVNAGSPKQENERKAKAVKGATKVDRLRNLYQSFHACQACALGTTRTKFVYGEGSPDASVMFVGEGPGRDEDLSGRPFVGPAGQLLDRIIEAMGLKRADVFIANVVKCRPPGNRAPLPDEMATCSPILECQITTVDPKVLVVLGSTALRFFKGPNAAITRSRGRFFQWRDYWVMPTFHPAYILRHPPAKRDVWEDIKQVMARLKDS